MQPLYHSLPFLCNFFRIAVCNVYLSSIMQYDCFIGGVANGFSSFVLQACEYALDSTDSQKRTCCQALFFVSYFALLCVLFLCFLQIKSEVLHCIVEGDTLYDLCKQLLIVGVLTVLYPVTDHLAYDTTEIIMSCV